LKQIEKMERQIHEERRRRLEDITARIEHVQNIIQYHRGEITKHLQTVEANEHLLDSLTTEKDAIQL
jgi:DNA-binding protein H-NS